MDVRYFNQEYYYSTTHATSDDIKDATCHDTTTDSKNGSTDSTENTPNDKPSHHQIKDSKNGTTLDLISHGEDTSDCNSYASSDDSTGSEYIYHPPPPLPSKRVDSMKDVRIIMDEDDGDDDENIVEESDRDEQNRPLLLKLRKRKPKANSTQQPSDLPPMFEMYRQRYLLQKQQEEQQEDEEINETLMMRQMTLKDKDERGRPKDNNRRYSCGEDDDKDNEYNGDDDDDEDHRRPMTSVYLNPEEEKINHHRDDIGRECHRHEYRRPDTMETIETREQEAAMDADIQNNAASRRRSSLISESSLLNNNSVEDANTYIQQKVQQRWYDSTTFKSLSELDFEDVDNNNEDESCTTCYDNEVDDEDSETGHVQDACDGSLACRRSSRHRRPSSSSLATTTHPFRARTPLSVLSSIAETATTTAMANHDVVDMGGLTTTAAFSNESHPFRSSISTSTVSSIRFNCDSHCNNHHHHHHDHSDGEDQGQRQRQSIIEIADPTMMWKATTTASTTAATAANNRHHQRRNVLNRNYEGFWTTEWDNEAKAWYYYNSFTGEATWFDPRQE